MIDWQAVYLPIGSEANELKGLKKFYDSRVKEGEFLLVSKDYYFHPSFLGYPSLLDKRQFSVEMILK